MLGPKRVPLAIQPHTLPLRIPTSHCCPPRDVGPYRAPHVHERLGQPERDRPPGQWVLRRLARHWSHDSDPVDRVDDADRRLL